VLRGAVAEGYVERAAARIRRPLWRAGGPPFAVEALGDDNEVVGVEHFAGADDRIKRAETGIVQHVVYRPAYGDPGPVLRGAVAEGYVERAAARIRRPLG
jgi:hypothetical protein